MVQNEGFSAPAKLSAGTCSSLAQSVSFNAVTKRVRAESNKLGLSEKLRRRGTHTNEDLVGTGFAIIPGRLAKLLRLRLDDELAFHSTGDRNLLISYEVSARFF